MPPENWTIARIGDFAWEPTDRATPGTEVLSITKNIGFVPSLEYFGKQVFSKDTVNYKLVRRGQFAYATIHLDEGSIASLMDRDRGIISPMYTVFDVDDRRVDRCFLLELLRTPAMLERYAAIGQGTVNRRKSIAFKALANETLMLPPLPEQKKIASILTAVDDAIQAIQRVIDQTQRVKEGLLQDLLTRGTRAETLSFGQHGTRPVSWSEPQAGSICKLITKGTTPPQATMRHTGDVPYLRVGNLRFDGSLDLTDLLFVDRSTHETILGRSIVLYNDVLTNIVGPPLGQVALVDNRHLQWNINQAIAIFRADTEQVLPAFLAMFLQWREAQAWLSSRAKQTSGQVNLTLELCRTLPVPLPTLEEQAEIVRQIDSVDLALQALVKTQGAQKTLKSGLLQDLLTGKVRVTP